MIRRLLSLATRSRRTPPPAGSYAGIDFRDAVLVDSARLRLLPCEGTCRAEITLHERTGADATCLTCGTVRSVTEGTDLP